MWLTSVTLLKEEDCPSVQTKVDLQSPLLVHLNSILVLGYFGSTFFLIAKCILDSLLQILALVKLEYIKWYESLGYPLG